MLQQFTSESERERERVNSSRRIIGGHRVSAIFKTAAFSFCVGVLFFGFATQVQATAITSAQAGNWSATGTWTGGVVPGSQTTVLPSISALDALLLPGMALVWPVERSWISRQPPFSSQTILLPLIEGASCSTAPSSVVIRRTSPVTTFLA